MFYLRNYTSLVSTNVGCNVHSSVGTLPPNTPTSDDSGTVQEPVSLTNGEPMASFQGSIHASTCSHTQDLESLTQNLESLRQSLSTLKLKQEQVKHHTKCITLHAEPPTTIPPHPSPTIHVHTTFPIPHVAETALVALILPPLPPFPLTKPPPLYQRVGRLSM